MTTTLDKVAILKSAEQDFEWYPTTDEMIVAAFRHCESISSMLDIGAGDGRVLKKFDELNFGRIAKREGWTEFVSTIDKFAIEKSEIHLNNMPPDISIVGTDFLAQTLIDKKVDVIFCNPPYSRYEEWATQIIKEANCNQLFLVLPVRWAQSTLIKQSIKTRNKVTHKVVWSGDFLEADREARAKVEIIKLTYQQTRYGVDYEEGANDAFDVWFDEYFADFDKLNHIPEENPWEKPKVKIGELVEGQNLLERLCNLYDNEMKTLLGNYVTLSKLDSQLLCELGVKVPELKKGLRSKIDGLKNKYWQELFDRFSPITNKLTSSSRRDILEKLHKSCNVDFSCSNVYAVAIWTIKNANKYIDRQVMEIFKELSEPESVKNYKSNLKMWERNGWRYKKEHTHYALDYRIVTVRHNAIYNGDGFGKYDYCEGLSNSCHDFLNDILTIANNLGFFNNESSKRKCGWCSGASFDFYDNQEKILFNVRAYKNGNVHFKFNQEFIKTLNIEASRLLGWIKTPEEAAEEMNIDLSFARSKFNSNLLLGIGEGRKLLCA